MKITPNLIPIVVVAKVEPKHEDVFVVVVIDEFSFVICNHTADFFYFLNLFLVANKIVIWVPCTCCGFPEGFFISTYTWLSAI